MWPVTAHIICLFAQFLSYNLKSPQSINNCVTGVCTLHLLINQPSDLNDFEWRIMYRGLKHSMKQTVKQAAPLTPLVLAQIHTVLNFKKRIDIVLWATLLVGFFIMVRVSNFVPVSAKKWSPIKQLTKSSIVFNRKGMIVCIKRSKTIQFRQKILEIPVHTIPHSILRPVKAVKHFLRINRASDKGPLFTIMKKKIFTYTMLQKKLKQVIEQIGLQKGNFLSHSIRRGAVVWEEHNGVPHDTIQIYRDWSSDAYKR